MAVKDTDGVVAGAVLEPFRGELFTATRGGGAWLAASRCRVSTNDVTLPLPSSPPGCSPTIPPRSRPTCGVSKRLHVHSRAHVPSARRRSASPTSPAGRLDAFYERDATYAWDVAAASLMITEAGGRCEDLDGGPLNFEHGIANVLGTNGAIHADLFDLIQRTDHAS